MLRSPVSRLFACLFLLPGCNFSPPIYDDPGVAVEDLYVYCDDGTSCAPYEVCVTDGVVWCEGRSCWTDGHTNLSCVRDIGGSSYMPPPSYPPDAGSPYMPPPTPTPTVCSVGYRYMPSLLQRGDGQSCLYEHRPEGRTWAGGWMNVICETGPCTIEVLSFTLYGVLPDGHVAIISSGIRWAGVWNNFFTSDSHTSASPLYGSTYHVPRLGEDAMLHLGGDVVNISGYTETFALAEFRTTGDAQAQVGADYRHGRDDIASTLEAGFSSYASCNSGGSIRVSSPRYGMTCEATLASASSPSAPPPEPPPPSTGSNFVITLPPAGTAGCWSGITARAWGASGEFSSSGSTLSFTVPTVGGIWWNMYCGGEAWGSRWGEVYNNPGANGVTVRVNGLDRTGNTMICQNAHVGDPYWRMPLTYLEPSLIGRCP